MKKEFVAYRIAHDLKELGFDEECLGVFDNQTEELFLNDTKELHVRDIPTIFTLAPLWQQVIDWLELNHGLIVEVNKLRWKQSGYIYYVKQYNKRNLLCKAAGYEHVATKYDGYKIGIEKALNIIIKRELKS